MLPVVIGREHERAALRQAILAKDKKNIERLEKLVEEREVSTELTLYFNAFIELDSERLFQDGPIPASAIRSWAADYELTFGQFDILRVVIRKIDNAVLLERGKKRPNGNSPQHREDRFNSGDRSQASRA